MDWFINLFIGSGIAHSICVLSLAITIGIFLGHKLKFKGITLGITWILFCAIACSHFGMTLDPMVESFAKDYKDVLDFAKDLGLILFVYSIGLQVGPSFFSSFRKGGLSLNMLALSIVLLGCITAFVIHLISGEPVEVMTGVLFGAVTNTPGLGAAQEAFAGTGADASILASGYAMAYPLGVVGIIVSILLIRWIFRIKLDKEEEKVSTEKGDVQQLQRFDIELMTPQMEGVRVRDLKSLTHVDLIASRVLTQDGTEYMPDADSVLHVGDKVRFVGDAKDERTVLLLGPKTEVKWEAKEKDVHLVNRHIIVTNSKLNGKRISDLKIREAYQVTITRIRRAGIELLATPELRLQMGDRLTVVGDQAIVEKMATSSLIIAILIGAFGPKFHLVTYTTSSANLMIREIGISLFLAAVGFGAGEKFVDVLLNGGYVWIGYGVLITMIPLLLVGFVGRKWMKLDYFTLMGLIAGSTTDPPALAYATSQSSNNDRAAVAYSTVYPLTMFLRVLTGQLMIILFV